VGAEKLMSAHLKSRRGEMYSAHWHKIRPVVVHVREGRACRDRWRWMVAQTQWIASLP